MEAAAGKVEEKGPAGAAAEAQQRVRIPYLSRVVMPSN
jgi:hypothetical protein